MTGQIKAVLLAEQERQGSVKPLLPEDYVCVNPNNQPISPNYYSQCFKKFLRDHGLREVRLHDLRHPNVKPKTKHFLFIEFLGHFPIRSYLKNSMFVLNS